MRWWRMRVVKFEDVFVSVRGVLGLSIEKGEGGRDVCFGGLLKKDER